MNKNNLKPDYTKKYSKNLETISLRSKFLKYRKLERKNFDTFDLSPPPRQAGQPALMTFIKSPTYFYFSLTWERRRSTCEEGTQTTVNWVENENYFGWFHLRDWNSFSPFFFFSNFSTRIQYLILNYTCLWCWLKLILSLIEQFEKKNYQILCGSARKRDNLREFECRRDVESFWNQSKFHDDYKTQMISLSARD